MIPFLDELTPAAQAIQAVNTIVNEDGVLVGHNTDGCGYTQNLRRNGIEVAGKKIVLLGGGGAASAIAIQAALEGGSLKEMLGRREREILRLYQQQYKSTRKMARLLGISQSSVVRKLHQYGLQAEDV